MLCPRSESQFPSIVTGVEKTSMSWFYRLSVELKAEVLGGVLMGLSRIKMHVKFMGEHDGSREWTLSSDLTPANEGNSSHTA